MLGATLLIRAAAIDWWASVYADSPAIETGLAFLHIGGLVLAGGLAVASDRATLRAKRFAAPMRGHVLDELHRVHRPVLIGLSVTALSGLLLLLADLDAMLGSAVFWAKMGLVVLLLANGALLARTESAMRGGRVDPGVGWRRLRRSAIASVVLWFVVLLAGAWLLNAA